MVETIFVLISETLTKPFLVRLRLDFVLSRRQNFFLIDKLAAISCVTQRFDGLTQRRDGYLVVEILVNVLHQLLPVIGCGKQSGWLELRQPLVHDSQLLFITLLLLHWHLLFSLSPLCGVNFS